MIIVRVSVGHYVPDTYVSGEVNRTSHQDTIRKRRDIVRRRRRQGHHPAGASDYQRLKGPSTRPKAQGSNKGKDNNKGSGEEKDEDLNRPYKEVLKSPFTRRIIEFSAPNHWTPTNLKIYDGSTDQNDYITRFVGAANQGEWEMPVWFVERFALKRKCSKDPTKVSKIIRRANETLPDFKERWTEEMSCIHGVPEVMQISAFMSNSKCLELARHFTDQLPQTVTEMMKRVDDFIKSEEAYKSTELPKGEHPEKGLGIPYNGNRPPHTGHRDGYQRAENYNTYSRRDHYYPYAPSRVYNRRYDNRRQEVNQLSLDSLIKRPKEIPAIELQL
ncbi:hypothetical protein Tco_0196425 [Tanacetum coccineum]